MRASVLEAEYLVERQNDAMAHDAMMRQHRALCAADKKEKKKGKAHRKYLLSRDALVEPFLKYGCRTAAYGSRKGMMIRRPGDDGRRMSAWRSPKKRSNAPHKQRHESSSKMSAGLRVGAVTLRAREEALPAHPCSCSCGVGCVS